jgi:hypothetical protein
MSSLIYLLLLSQINILLHMITFCTAIYELFVQTTIQIPALRVRDCRLKA